MAVSLIQFRDQRLPPPSPPVDRRIDFVDNRKRLDADENYFSLAMHDDEHAVEDIDEDAPLAAALERPIALTRSSSVGNSWGVTSVGRGFDWRSKREVEAAAAARDVAVEEKSVPPHEDNEDPPSSTYSSSSYHEEDRPRRNATVTQDDLSRGAGNWVETTTNPTTPSLTTNEVSPPSASQLPDLVGETSHLNDSTSSKRSSIESTKQDDEPITPTSPHSPLMVRRDVSASGRPIIAGRSQSMYIVPSASPRLEDDDSLAPAPQNASPGTKAHRARAWSRPVSPVRSSSHPHPTLQTSSSTPSMAGLQGFMAFTPMVISGGALMTPTTPRSPRLNRSRASQKRISLIAGREVAGLHYLEGDVLPQPDDDDDWVSFGRGRRPVASPEPDEEQQEPTSAKVRGLFADDDYEAVVSHISHQSREASGASRLSRRQTRSRPETPGVIVEEPDWKSHQIKGFGAFNSSLFLDANDHPPTPLRTASSAPKQVSGDEVGPRGEPADDDDEVKRDLDITPMTLNAGGFSTSGSFASLVAQASEDVQIPAEEAPPVYPSLDKPHPDWSLHRMSSSWSISSKNHQHRPSTSSSKARSPSAEPQGDGVEMMMKRMQSSASIKRMSSESGRRGGFLGGRTIDDYVILADAGRGAYGLVKRAKERKMPLIDMDEEGNEVVVEDVNPDETVGPPLIIKQIIKSRILADCWKKHPIHGTIPIEIYVMSAVSGTSYVLPKPRAWDPRRFEDPEDIQSQPHLNGSSITPPSRDTLTPGSGSRTPTGGGAVKITLTPIHAEPEQVIPSPTGSTDDVTELDMWRWREGELIKGHPNICPLEDFFEDSSYYYLVLPATRPSFPKMPAGMEQTIAVEGGKPPSDLFDLVEQYPSGLPGPLVRTYLGQIADALSFLHARGICHRDIKDENVVLGEHGRCWLIDFGSSGVIRKNGWDTFSGTLDYAAPEILKGARYAGPPQDVWAYGIVAYVLLVGECPFVSSVEAAQGLEDPEGKPAMALRARCSGGPAGFDEGTEIDGGGRLGDAMELVRRCLDLDVANRPTMEQVLTCRYLNGGQGWGQPLDEGASAE